MGGWAGGADWVLKGYRVGWVFEVPEWSPRAFLKVAHRTKAELPGDPRSPDGCGEGAVCRVSLLIASTPKMNLERRNEVLEV